MKEIYDPIHGFITITPLMEAVIDTPEFQRLRELKQLGATHYVFPSATHTRFEHSIGVSHLAGVVMTQLSQVAKDNDDSFIITPRHIELVRIAGLVHDIGHGPYSHLYDDYVVGYQGQKHEERGCAIFEGMVQRYKLALKPEEVSLIQRMVNPTDKTDIRHWMFQIVSNKACQLDVDKIDYIQRDCYYVGLKYSGQYLRLLTGCRRAYTHEGHEVLAWPLKLKHKVFTLFETRYRLHKEVYHHPAIMAHEYVISRMLQTLAAHGTQLHQMTDSAVVCPFHTTLRADQARLARRMVPKMIGEISIHPSEEKKDPQGLRQILDILIHKFTIGFSSHGGNPLRQVYYFDPNETTSGPLVATRIDPFAGSSLLPRGHQESIIRLYHVTGPNAATQAEWEEMKARYPVSSGKAASYDTDSEADA